MKLTVIGFITDRELREGQSPPHPSLLFLTCHMLSFGIQSERIFYPPLSFTLADDEWSSLFIGLITNGRGWFHPSPPQATSTRMFINSNVNSKRLIRVNFIPSKSFFFNGVHGFHFLLPCRWWLMRLIQIVLHTRERSGLQVDSTPIGWINRRTNTWRSRESLIFVCGPPITFYLVPCAVVQYWTRQCFVWTRPRIQPRGGVRSSDDLCKYSAYKRTSWPSLTKLEGQGRVGSFRILVLTVVDPIWNSARRLVSTLRTFTQTPLAAFLLLSRDYRQNGWLSTADRTVGSVTVVSDPGAMQTGDLGDVLNPGKLHN